LRNEKKGTTIRGLTLKLTQYEIDGGEGGVWKEVQKDARKGFLSNRGGEDDRRREKLITKLKRWGEDDF